MDELSRQAERLAALGHPVRLAILRHVVQGEVAGTPVGEIQQALGIPASTLSHHLGTLAAAQLVRVERQGTTLRYRADFDTLRALTSFIWEDCCGRDAISGPDSACCPTDALLPVCAQPEASAPALEPSSVATEARREPGSSWSPDMD